MRNNQDTLTDSKERKTTYDVWVQHEEGEKHWYCRRYGFEKLKDAKQYVKEHTENYLCPENFKVVKMEVHRKLTVL